MPKVARDKTTLLWRAKLAWIRARGVSPDDADIVWVRDLARAAITGGARCQTFLHAPVRLCGCDFYVPTIQARIWLQDVLTWWTRSDAEAAGFALAHSSGSPEDAETLARLSERRTIERAVTRWAKGCRVPCDALAGLARALLGHLERVEVGAPVASGVSAASEIEARLVGDAAPLADEWGPLIARAAGMTGIPPRTLAMEYTADEIADLIRRAPRDGGGLYDCDEYTRQANAELDAACAYIVRRHKESDGSAQP